MEESRLKELLGFEAILRAYPAQKDAVAILLAKKEKEYLNTFYRHGDFARWSRPDSALSKIAGELDIAARAPGYKSLSSCESVEEIEALLRALMPWKKGPYRVGEVQLDAEWDCSLKWERLKKIGVDFADKHILDVGCGNGYFMFRMAAERAALVLGLEPSVFYASQFLGLQSLMRVPNLALLPTTAEEFSQDSEAFDIALSMGVLYHRRSPFDHLMQLKGFLKPGGQLVLETIVVEGEEGYSLVPKDRYAQMRNVWFLPSVPTLCQWLRRVGLVVENVGETVPTLAEEQRSTAFMIQPSLDKFLDPSDPTKTIEGYPAPKRVMILARRPGLAAG